MHGHTELWELGPSDDQSVARIYGNVSSTSSWKHWQLEDEFFPARLFLGPSDAPWQESVAVLPHWNDFIWSDDAVPWATERAVEALRSSGLTGFDLERIIITDIGNESMEDVPQSALPTLYRLRVEATFEPDVDSVPAQTSSWRWCGASGSR